MLARSDGEVVDGHLRLKAGRKLEIAELMLRRLGKVTQVCLTEATQKPAETKKVSQGLLAALSEAAISEVKKNGVLALPGIGRLVRVDRKARMGRNPATGEAIKIAAKKVVKFRIAKGAKDAIVPPKKAKD